MPKRREYIFTLIILSLITVGLVCIQPIRSQNNGYSTYTINNDGIVTPATTLIQQTDNIYTLTGDIRGNVIVQRSNIVFDGSRHSIIGGSDEIGIGGITVGSLPTAPTVGISYTSNVTLKNFLITGSVYGISLWQCSNVIVANNSISGTGNGILSLDQGTAGINVEGGKSNTIVGNTLANNYNGIALFQTENNLIFENTVKDSSNPYGVSAAGIAVWEGVFNTAIYHNNFVRNSQQVYLVNGLVTVWDDGYPSGGNYWSDYQTKYPRAQMIDNSGIGNVSYVINSQNKDNYPLMAPFDYNLYLFRTTKPDIQMLSSENRTVSSSNVTLSFTVDKATSWIGYSLDGQQNVTVTGNFTIANMTNGIRNLSIYANDTFGNIGVQTANFTVELPTPAPANSPIAAQTLPIIAVVTVLAVIVVSLLLLRRHRKTSKP